MVNLLYQEKDTERQTSARVKEGDGRSAYRRDWARLIHSAYWRRLQGKTQLFPSDENDSFRNRLTHSLEVAQIASGLALNLNQYNPFFRKNTIDEDLVYFAGLAHDLGHPPFGHNGEKALDRLMVRAGGFEGNAQTLRVLSRIEKRETSNFPKSEVPRPVVENNDRRLGLNVTFRSLASVLKYDREIPRLAEERSENDRNRPVKGYYFTEKELVGEIKRNVIGTEVEEFKTIECSIMDIADDIAYSTYDLEDAFKGGFMNPLKILAFDDKFKQTVVNKVNREIHKTYNGKFDDQKLNISSLNNIIVSTFERIFTISKVMIEKFKDVNVCDPDVLADISTMGSGQTASASAALCENGYLRGEFTSKLVTEFMSAIKANPCESYPQLSSVSFDIDTFKKVEVLKTICYESIISSPRLKMAERRGSAILNKIFKTLVNEAEGRKLLPEDWAEVYFGFHSDDMRKRTICDYIASMTDRYCVEFYSRIVGINPPSIHKPY
jgi:dGTPase